MVTMFYIYSFHVKHGLIKGPSYNVMICYIVQPAGVALKWIYDIFMIVKLPSPLFLSRVLKGQREPWRVRMNWKQIVSMTLCPLVSPCHLDNLEMISSLLSGSTYHFAKGLLPLLWLAGVEDKRWINLHACIADSMLTLFVLCMIISDKRPISISCPPQWMSKGDLQNRKHAFCVFLLFYLPSRSPERLSNSLVSYF